MRALWPRWPHSTCLRNLGRRGSGLEHGFSLIEVLITMVIAAIGLLGLAKMQAAALSNTQVSRSRSLIALQAGSLASSMHGNPGYWAAGLAPATVTASGTTVVDATGVLTGTTNCTTSVCTAGQLAAFDFNSWVVGLNQHFPTYTATVNCTIAAGAPIACSINLTWTEKYVAVSYATAASAGSQASIQSFTLRVEP